MMKRLRVETIIEMSPKGLGSSIEVDKLVWGNNVHLTRRGKIIYLLKSNLISMFFWELFFDLCTHYHAN